MRTRTGYSMGVWLTAVLLVAFAVGCGDNHGANDNNPTIPTATTVSSVTPLDKATGVAVNTKIITATFSQAMDSTTLTTGTFTLACPVGTAQTGAVTYVANSRVATLTLAGNLPAGIKCTATITTGVKNVAGQTLDTLYTWTFTTGVTPDTTKPLVTLTAPVTTTPGPTLAVPTNTAITAVFNEDMVPIPAAGFTLTCAACVLPPTGTVTYAVGSRTAIFTPAAVLEAGKTYTATIKGTGANAATDLALNALAGNSALPTTANDYVWTFTTAAAVPAASVSVPSLNLNPAAGAGPVGVCSNTAVNATFTVPSGLRMDPLSVNAGTFTLTGPGVTNVLASSVVLDGPTGLIATFTPQNSLTSGVLYTATIKGGATGVKDLAIPANTMVADKTWTFTAGPATVNCQAPEPLGAASLFGFFSGLSLTGEGDDPNSRITGDVGTTGAAAKVKGFHDSLLSYSETCPAAGAAVGCGLVTGTIYAAGAITTAAAGAANTAYLNLAPGVRTGGLDVATCVGCGGGLPGELGGRTLAPGVYASVPGSYAITAGDLTLDAQGNANAVWVFQAATTLTVSSPAGPLLTVSRTVHLINGAQAKNVFWYVGTAATINTGSHMVGNIISTAATTFGTSDIRPAPPAGAITTLDGRAMSLTAGVTMVNTQINVPAP